MFFFVNYLGDVYVKWRGFSDVLRGLYLNSRPVQHTPAVVVFVLLLLSNKIRISVTTYRC